MATSGEDDLIARHFAPIAGPAGLGLLDDAACLPVAPGRELVLTADALVAGVHFLPDDPPETIAVKALGVNMSDLAAKGADPEGFLLSLALPDGWTESWLGAFATGLADAASRHRCPLLGGDTVRTPGPLTISVTAVGTVPSGTMVRRTNARPGDLVCVTGTIGDAALGLVVLTASPPAAWAAALSDDHRNVLIDRYRRPRPRLAVAPTLRAHANAAMDVSDGLAGDLAKLLRAGGVTGTLDLDSIPLSPAATAALAREPALLDRIAGGGDDYEVVFTLPPERLDIMAREAAAAGVSVTAIGHVRQGSAPLAVLRGGSPYRLERPSFQHSWTGAAP